MTSTDFSIPKVSNEFGYYPSPANYVRPYARPLSSIAPLIICHGNGSLYAILGASGGSRIITTTLQNAIHILDGEMSLKEALARPRLHDQLIPNMVVLEQSYDNSTAEFLRGRNHELMWKESAGSSAQAIRLVDGTLEAEGEPRQRDSGGLTI